MKILLLSVHPPHGGGSANSSQELAIGLRQLGHVVVQIAPYKVPKQLADYPDLIWIPANFSGDLTIHPKAKADIDHQVATIYRQRGPFDLVILGRESFLWHLPNLRKIHGGPIIGICRGAYINQLVSDDTIPSQLKEELISLYRGCDLIICIANHLAQSVHQVTGSNNTLFLPNPIRLPSFDPDLAYHPAPEDPIRILMAAQIKPRKRPFDAIEMMKILVDQGENIHLTICGEGIEMDEMKALIQAYALTDHITVRGKVNRQDVLACLNQVETVLLCSDNEGRPRILQEAIAAGKSIVAADNPGSREVLMDWIGPWNWGRLFPHRRSCSSQPRCLGCGPQATATDRTRCSTDLAEPHPCFAGLRNQVDCSDQNCPTTGILDDTIASHENFADWGTSSRWGRGSPFLRGAGYGATAIRT